MSKASRAGGLDLDAIAARLKAATPAPWAWANNNDKGYGASVGAECFAEDDIDAERPLSGDLTHREDDYIVLEPIAEMAEDQPAARNADFIAHAPEDIAALLAEVRALRTALRRIEICAKFAGAEGHGDYRDIEADASMTLALAVLGAPERDL